nr:hypothetical protein [Tanacetum cinerariifolium]
PLSPTYIPDPMELDKHAPLYVLEPQHPKYHAPSDEDIQVEDDNEDPEKDPEDNLSVEHEPEDDDEDPEEDPNEEHESKGSKETAPPQTPMAASTQALIDAFASGSSPFPLQPTSPAYDQAQLGRRAAMIHRKDDILEEDMPPQKRFALTGSPPGVEDASYVRALQASKRRMMTSIEEVNLRVSYQAQVHRQESENFYTQLPDAETDRRDIRLEIDVVRGQRTAYETDLQE